MTGHLPCALVVNDSGAGGAPDLVVVVFHSPAEADAFARDHGFDDWVVAPLGFRVDFDERRRRAGGRRPARAD